MTPYGDIDHPIRPILSARPPWSAPPDPPPEVPITGVWCVWTFGEHVWPFPTEIEALRFAQHRNAALADSDTFYVVSFVQWGEPCS